MIINNWAFQNLYLLYISNKYLYLYHKNYIIIYKYKYKYSNVIYKLFIWFILYIQLVLY